MVIRDKWLYELPPIFLSSPSHLPPLFFPRPLHNFLSVLRALHARSQQALHCWDQGSITSTRRLAQPSARSAWPQISTDNPSCVRPSQGVPESLISGTCLGFRKEARTTNTPSPSSPPQHTLCPACTLRVVSASSSFLRSGQVRLHQEARTTICLISIASDQHRQSLLRKTLAGRPSELDFWDLDMLVLQRMAPPPKVGGDTVHYIDT